MQQLKAEHSNILGLEAKSHENEANTMLATDICFLRSTPVRFVYEFYKRDKYDIASQAGWKLMMGLLSEMESNKAIEDTHLPVRTDAEGNQNLRLSKDHIQDRINHSGVLEARGVRDCAQVGQDAQPDHLNRLFFKVRAQIKNAGQQSRQAAGVIVRSFCQ